MMERKGKGKGSKGEESGKAGKGKGKGGGGKGDKGKSGPKGGCFHCGGDHYQSDCPKAGKGHTGGTAFALSALKQVEVKQCVLRSRANTHVRNLGDSRSGVPSARTVTPRNDLKQGRPQVDSELRNRFQSLQSEETGE